MARLRKTEEELTNTYIDERVERLLPQIEALAPFKTKKRADGDRNQGIKGWRTLAVEEAINLKNTYPDNEAYWLRQITALKKALRESVASTIKDKANFHPCQTIIVHFGEALSFLFSVETKNKNDKNQKRVAIVSAAENRIELDLSSFIKKAHKTLLACYNGATKTDIEWRDVSCSLALCTGRRMAEIHASANFKLVDHHTVIFTGQLKGKKRKIEVGENQVALRDYEFTIPTLVEAKLILAGLNWLEAEGKRLKAGEDPEIVNRRWSKVLSERVKSNWLLFEETTYHKFRGAYYCASIMNTSLDYRDYEDYAKSILGDDHSDTIKAYKRFTLKPGSITVI